MKNILTIAAMMALPVGLSGCDKKPETPKVEAPKAVATTDAMSNMAMPADSKKGKATGTVIAVNTAAGTITLEHSAIPAVGWSAMTMGFSAKPGVLTGIAVGDKVDFDVTVKGSAGEVTAIKKH
jgi:Cu(I)/Ag(I) efflux system protein CusF